VSIPTTQAISGEHRLFMILQNLAVLLALLDSASHLGECALQLGGEFVPLDLLLLNQFLAFILNAREGGAFRDAQVGGVGQDRTGQNQP